MRRLLLVTGVLVSCRPTSEAPPEPAALFGASDSLAHTVDYEPAWSPTGSHLAFISNRDGALKVYLVAADGTGLRKLTDGPAEDDAPSWSPDGARIAFVSLRDGNAEIYVVNVDGSGQVRLTDDPAIDIHPIWAADGASILWNSSRRSQRPDDPETFEVFTMQPDGREQRPLTEGGIATYASWSPDGTRLLFRRHMADDNSEIVLLDPASGSEVNLTGHPAFDGWPSWSPDGRRVVFAREQGDDAEIRVIQTDGTEEQVLVPVPGRNTNPRWSPDGRQIVFSRRMPGRVRLYLLPVPEPR